MSIRQGKKLIASSTTNGFNLFDCKWADHILNNISWLRADTFSWQSGDVYVAAYQHLTEEFASVTEWSYETVGGVYIGYKLMPDGHKITDASSEQYVQAIYEATGVAWYYILDTTNRQFKLPRTKWGFTGLRDSVGGYVAPGLPNITGSVTRNLYSDTPTATGSFVKGSTSNTNLRNDGTGEPAGTLSFDASRSSSVYGNSNTVQPPATQMYLYFYVGNFAQSAIEQTAGLNAEMFNDLNAHKVIDFQAPTSANGYTWYRKYADGWVEQGGLLSVAGDNNAHAVTFAIEMQDTNYMANIQRYTATAGQGTAATVGDFTITNLTKTSLSVPRGYNGPIRWEVKGMSA